MDALESLQREHLRLKWMVADLKLDLLRREFALKYQRGQPRVPAGNPDGGQWTREGGGGNDSRIISDATPDDTWKPGARYAQNIQPPPNSDSAYRGQLPAHIPPDVDIDRNIKEAEAHKRNFAWFHNQVRNKGPWDYKQLDQAYADFGNFNYGATGRAAGFSEATLLRAAGWAQVQAGTSHPGWGTPVTLFQALLGVGGKPPFGDDPRDQYWVSTGSRYYDARRARPGR